MSTSLDDLTATQPEIEKENEKDIVSINMPFYHYPQEVQLVIHRFFTGRAKLEAGGMDFNMVDKAHLLVGACRELHSRVSAVVLPTSAAQSQWNSAYEEAEYLTYDVKEALLYACRNFPEVAAKISYINEGGSNPDFIQDLNDYAALGRSNRELLLAIGYDLANLERLAELSKILSDLYAQVTLDRSTTPENTILRNKAFSLLKKTIDELNKHARYIYRANKEEAANFIIRPPKKKPTKKVVEKKEKVVA